MSTKRPDNSGKSPKTLQTIALFCIPAVLIACLFSYVQIVVLGERDVGSLNFLYPIALGLTVGMLMFLIRKRGQTLAQRMITDPLTSCLNRRWYLSASEDLSNNCKKDGQDLSAILFDIDHFRQINEVNGNQAGDEVLRQISTIVRRSLRGSDWLVRWGGEEFLILLPDTAAAEALIISERLRTVIASYSFKGANLITCSFGVSTLEAGNKESLDEVISAADSAMLAAKQAGRNQVKTSDSVEPNNAVSDSNKTAEVHEVSSQDMQKHAIKLLDAAYARKLLFQPLVIALLLYPVLALVKNMLIDNVSIGVSHLLLPVITAFILGYLIGRLRILGKAIDTQNIVDPLTKAYNRHWLSGYGRQQIQSARRTGNPLSLALIDVDNFKAINDRHGTAAGDMVLGCIANSVREVCGESANLVRWSGKVFMLLLPDVESDQALEIAENIRTVVDAREANGLRMLSCSIGLTCFNKEEDKELHHMVERATRAMNQASEQGMNCVRVG